MENEKKELQEGAVAAVSKPGEYSSQWQGQLEDAIGKILDRKDFSYDVNGDALYQQYKDRYVQGGKMAMMDTMGQAATLTGGYGNSYAQGVGQQAYQGYLRGLNDKIPELYQLALDSYDRKTDSLYRRYSLLGAREGQDYERYQGRLNQYQQSWENALRLYQLGVRTPEVLGMLGIPKQTGGGSGGDREEDKPASGGRRQKTVEEIYMEAKQGGASARELDSYLKQAISEGAISSWNAKELREKRW